VTRPVILYATASLDGFIAGAGGSMHWLDAANSEATDFGYSEFYATIDTMLMGSATYEFVLGAADPFPHADRQVFVFTSRELPRPADSVTLVHEDAVSFTRRLKDTSGEAIWLVGGGKLNATMLEAALIDEIRLFVQPVLLGEGIGLFDGKASAPLSLTHTARWPAGVVELRFGVM
jgi:dihydrofolate reductase